MESSMENFNVLRQKRIKTENIPSSP